MSLSNYIFVAFLYLFYLFSLTIGFDGCKLINPCKCEFENGTGIDLTPLNSTIFKTVVPDQKENTFFFNACGNGTKTNLPNHIGTSCDDGFSVNITSKKLESKKLQNCLFRFVPLIQQITRR